jgi:hypothetical protein
MSYEVTLSQWECPTVQSVQDWCDSIHVRPTAISINGRLVSISLPHTAEGEIDQDRIGNVAVKDFAQAHRFRTAMDECGERIIPGRRKTASQLFFYGNQPGESDVRTMAVMFMPDPHGKQQPRTGAWNNRRAALHEAGCLVVCDVDGEGHARFDPLNAYQVRVACEIGHVRPKRKVDPERMRLLAEKGRLALAASTL